MMEKKTKIILNLSLTLMLAVFLWWAQGNLDGFVFVYADGGP